MEYFKLLTSNLRFYILASTTLLTLGIYFGIKQFIADEYMQTVSLTQFYALAAVTYLYFTLLASPLTRIFPQFPYRAKYIFARRALGASAFMFGALHYYFALFKYIGGPEVLLAMPFESQVPVLLGSTAFLILFLMAITSFDLAIAKLSAVRWKFLHRFVYLAAALITAHALLLGSHFKNLSETIPLIFFAALSFLLVLESIRFNRYLNMKFIGMGRFFIPQIVVAGLLAYSSLKIFS